MLAEEEQAEEEDERNEESDSEDENQGEEDNDEGQSLLTDGNQMDGQNEESEGQNEVELIPVLLLEPEEAEGQPVYELATNDEGKKGNKTEREERPLDKRNSPNEEAISKGEQSELDELMHKMLANKQPGMRHLSDQQLTRLVQFVRQLQTLLEANVVERG